MCKVILPSALGQSPGESLCPLSLNAFGVGFACISVSAFLWCLCLSAMSRCVCFYLSICAFLYSFVQVVKASKAIRSVGKKLGDIAKLTRQVLTRSFHTASIEPAHYCFLAFVGRFAVFEVMWRGASVGLHFALGFFTRMLRTPLGPMLW